MSTTIEGNAPMVVAWEQRTVNGAPTMVAVEQKKSWFGFIGRTWNNTVTRADTEVKALWRAIARRRLESDLSDIIKTATGHKKDKVANGDSRYQELWRIADQKVTDFCVKHEVSRVSIDAQIPALTELQQLATVPVVIPHRNAKIAIGGFVAGSVAITTLGALCAYVHDLFIFGNHIMGWIGHLIHLL